MVSTRNHPRAFPPPDLSPSKRSRATDSPEADLAIKQEDAGASAAVVYIPASGATASDAILAARTSTRALTAWTHTASTLTLAWLVFSLPLVAWDVGYVLLRPHTFPQGKWHAPLWSAYANYVTIDYLYSPLALANNDGFVGAQSAMNVVETLLYLGYAALVLRKGRRTGSGLERRLVGRDAAVAALLGFATFVMTLAKTILYAFVGYYSGFPILKENNWTTIFFLFIVPNGAWIVVPSILAYAFGSEIVDGLERAAGLPAKKLS